MVKISLILFALEEIKHSCKNEILPQLKEVCKESQDDSINEGSLLQQIGKIREFSIFIQMNRLITAF